MPTVATVLGISIMFFYDDHDPPHFHAHGADFDAKFAISDLRVIEIRGRARPNELRALREWAARHRAELFDNWARARRMERLSKIED